MVAVAAVVLSGVLESERRTEQWMQPGSERGSTNQLWRSGPTHLDMHGIVSVGWACRKQKTTLVLFSMSMSSHTSQKTFKLIKLNTIKNKKQNKKC